MIEGWIQTYTGKRFRPLMARAEDVDIRDIAHALALNCRFNGHCREFYSVAEHSVRVSRILESHPLKIAPLWGLMHDAGESYLADLGGPIKGAFYVHHGAPGGMEKFGDAEDRLLAVIAKALGFEPVDYAVVRQADMQMLVTEARDLLGGQVESWLVNEEPLQEKIVPLGWREAEAAFLTRWEQLRSAT